MPWLSFIRPALFTLAVSLTPLSASAMTSISCPVSLEDFHMKIRKGYKPTFTIHYPTPTDPDGVVPPVIQGGSGRVYSFSGERLARTYVLNSIAHARSLLRQLAEEYYIAVEYPGDPSRSFLIDMRELRETVHIYLKCIDN